MALVRSIGLGREITPLEYDSNNNEFPNKFATIADLKAATWLQVGQVVAVEEYHAGVGGGMLFGRIVAGGTGTDDGGSYIDLTASGFQFKQNFPAIKALTMFGAIPDYDKATKTGTDNEVAIQAALDSGDGVNMNIISGGGKAYRLGAGVKFKKGFTVLRDFIFAASPSYDSGTIVYTDMGTAFGGATAIQKSNRGNAMIRMVRDDGLLTTESEYRLNTLENFVMFCNYAAPGICTERAQKSSIKNFEIFGQKGYGIAILVKNGALLIDNGKISEAEWGSPVYINGTYSAAGIVQTCADVLMTNTVSHYSEYPYWADGFVNTQMSNVHFYNGNGAGDALPNMYYGPDANGIVASNIYMDYGYAELHSFSHVFSGGLFVTGTANKAFARLVAQGPSQEIKGLTIEGVKCGDSSHKTFEIDETLGNITTVNGCKLPAMANGGGSALPIKTGYANDKYIRETVDVADWVVAGSYFTYTLNIDSDLAFPNAYTEIDVEFKDLSTGTTSAPINVSYRFDGFATAGSKDIEIRSATASKIQVKVMINECFGRMM